MNYAGTAAPTPRPTYSPLVRACAAYGIGRTRAFEYAKLGLLETFKIGTRTYVSIESLDTLPRRLAEAASAAQ